MITVTFISEKTSSQENANNTGPTQVNTHFPGPKGRYSITTACELVGWGCRRWIRVQRCGKGPPYFVVHCLAFSRINFPSLSRKTRDSFPFSGKNSSVAAQGLQPLEKGLCSGPQRVWVKLETDQGKKKTEVTNGVIMSGAAADSLGTWCWTGWCFTFDVCTKFKGNVNKLKAPWNRATV